MEVEPRPLGADEQLLFLHIPKTAGTSLIRLLDQHFVEDELCPVDWPYRQVTREITAEEVQRAKFIRGHFELASIKGMFVRPPRIITMLRDPVERFVSEFEHIRRIVLGEVPRAWVPDFARPYVQRREQAWKNEYLEISKKKLELDDFVRLPKLYQKIANTQTRMLSVKQDTAEAKQYLDTFAFVGIAEAFERSVELLCYILGLPTPIEIGWYNRAPKRRKRGRRWALSETVKHKIAQIEALDLELYAYARARFEREYAAMRQAKKRKRFRVVFSNSILETGSVRSGADFWFSLRRAPIGYGWSTAVVHPRFGILREVAEERRLHWPLPSLPAKGRIMVGFLIQGDMSQMVWRFEINGHAVPVTWHRSSPSEHVASIALPPTAQPNALSTQTAVMSLFWKQRSTWLRRLQNGLESLARRLLYHSRCQGRCQKWVRRLIAWTGRKRPVVLCQWIGFFSNCVRD